MPNGYSAVGIKMLKDSSTYPGQNHRLSGPNMPALNVGLYQTTPMRTKNNDESRKHVFTEGNIALGKKLHREYYIEVSKITYKMQLYRLPMNIDYANRLVVLNAKFSHNILRVLSIFDLVACIKELQGLISG